MKKTVMIRHYIIAQMYHSGSSSIRIMSARELARHFDVAQSTVSLALKELMDEGYIFSRPGLGNFTNPLRLPVYQDRPQPPLVGLMQGDGRFFFMNRQCWQRQRAFGNAIVAAGWNLRNIELSCPLNREAAQELQDTRIDALLWTGAYQQQEFAEELSALGIPVVSDSPYFPQFSSVSADPREYLQAFVDYAVEHSYTSLLIWEAENLLPTAMEILRQIIQEQGVTLRVEPLRAAKIFSDEYWLKYFSRNKQVLVFTNEFSESSGILSHYASHSGARIEYYRKFSGYRNGVSGEFRCDEALATAMVQRLQGLLAGESAVTRQSVPYTFYPFQ